MPEQNMSAEALDLLTDQEVRKAIAVLFAAQEEPDGDRFDQGVKLRILNELILRFRKAYLAHLDAQARQAKENKEMYHRVMNALVRSRMSHGDCESGERYGGVPKACTACMAQLEIDEMIAAYRGRPVRIR